MPNYLANPLASTLRIFLFCLPRRRMIGTLATVLLRNSKFPVALVSKNAAPNLCVVLSIMLDISLKE